ncbi:hypothetical protein KVR01_013265 [Diaporthe batatas]|uniref:uncharacterized protein n=1 Tax=Diaporthe batatas TaxID=748121 RepID=UPI001D04E5ED|nr:uncharacterized protein KVR01_013265 [Diaporthe batatas]KAG8156852.1 hypothetical protein KVR01_013265 [Diaporthe batatas]
MHVSRLSRMAQNSSVPKSSCVKAALDRIWDLDFKPRIPTPDYPPISSIPRTSPDRLQRATPKEPPVDHLPSLSPSANDYLYDHTASVPTVLYLAYGSNLCAQTFLGQRGIRPVSAVNVSAPSLRLTFDLPGIPYKEPCFANTAVRKIPKHPPIPDPPGKVPDLPRPPPYTFPPQSDVSDAAGVDKPSAPQHTGARGHVSSNAHGDPEWDKGLIGVVYEVTPEDYATIIKTEGGGSAYQDILVPCIAIPNRVGIPEDPPIPELPKPFFAHTLFAPRIPEKPDDGDGDDGNKEKNGARAPGDGNDGDDDGDGDDKTPLDRLKEWWQDMLLKPIRPDPEYAQPSARYLKLIADGAAEHGLPDEYQAWLAKLQPYTITSRRQTIGQFLLIGLVMPLMSLFFGLSKWLADDRGRIPLWLGLYMETLFHVVWLGYDRVFKPVFGDGERTEDEDERRRQRGPRRLLKKSRINRDEEKLALIPE